MGNRRWAAGAAALAICLAAAHAEADPDFDPESVAWSGLSELVQTAADSGYELQVLDEVDLGQLRPRSGLLIVHPTVPLPAAALSHYMRAGGRVAIADDFGSGDALLRHYKIGRTPPPRTDAARRLRGNRNVVIARPRSRHPLTRDVLALVANHPQALHHHELEAVYALEGDASLVLAGGVGKGRLVAISDSSVFINNMMEFRGNRTFAVNLMSFLTESGSRPLYLVHDSVRVTGEPDPGGPGSALATIEQGLRNLADAELPAAAVSMSTLIAGLLLLLFAWSALPAPATFARGLTLPAPAPTAGFAGRLSLYESPGENLYHPLMAYKLELETHLVERLRLPPRPSLDEVTRAMRAAGLPGALITDTRQLLVELDGLHALRDRSPSPPKIGERRFASLVSVGRQLTEALDGMEQA